MFCSSSSLHIAHIRANAARNLDGFDWMHWSLCGERYS
jgi:hypothetical protein